MTTHRQPGLRDRAHSAPTPPNMTLELGILVPSSSDTWDSSLIDRGMGYAQDAGLRHWSRRGTEDAALSFLFLFLAGHQPQHVPQAAMLPPGLHRVHLRVHFLTRFAPLAPSFRSPVHRKMPRLEEYTDEVENENRLRHGERQVRKLVSRSNMLPVWPASARIRRRVLRSSDAESSTKWAGFAEFLLQDNILEVALGLM